jgi:hypothetical protein
LPIYFNFTTNQWLYNQTFNDFSNFTDIHNLTINVTGNAYLTFNGSTFTNITFNLNDNATMINNYPNATMSSNTTCPTIPVLVTTTPFPKCHTPWDVAIVTLIAVLGFLLLLALAALAFLLLRKPTCMRCGTRHTKGFKHCPNEEPQPPAPQPHDGQYGMLERDTGPGGRSDGPAINLPQN